MFRPFSFTFDDLRINPDSLGIIMGFHPEKPPDPFPEYIAMALAEGTGLFDATAGYIRLQPVHFDHGTKQISAHGRSFSPGRLVFNEMHDSPEIVLFAASAGDRVTARCRELNNAGEMIYSYVLDVLGSVVAEKSAGMMADLLEKEVAANGWSITDSYSPGYCDWNVAEQQILFSLLPPGCCGISLSPSSLMTPVKSVSGMIGIGPHQQKTGNRCRRCTDQNCTYGNLRRKGLLNL